MLSTKLTSVLKLAKGKNPFVNYIKKPFRESEGLFLCIDICRSFFLLSVHRMKV